MLRKGWSDLPPDLLREIAGRLHVATDFVTFHAVCKPWRSSHDLSSGTTTTAAQLLPWFHALTEEHGQSTPFKYRCIFSKSGYRVLPRRRRNWVCSADGATVGYLTVKQLRPTLHNPVTGAVTDLPRFPHYPWEENNPCGIVYGDGSTFLYCISRNRKFRTIRFRAAVLRLSDAKWTLVDRTFETSGSEAEFCAAYHNGKFLVCWESSLWQVVTPDDSFEVLVPRSCMEQDESDERSNYILESRGELLWASVQVQDSCAFPPRIKTFVSVHALEDATVRWVEKEGHFLADRVLFLGSPNSFAVDASILGDHGGCAYFVYQDSDIEESGLFRYSFTDGKTDRIQRLPKEWNDDKCTWLVPQPTIAPIQQIMRRKLQSQKPKKHQKSAPINTPSRICHIERHYEHWFRVLVRDLPLKVKSSELQLFFSKHGKVSSTNIFYHKNTKNNKGIVQMATMHAHEEDALAALRGLDFHGCSLEVILVLNNRQRRQRS